MLNYIIENRTILWWGGLGRSTEHTAYLNLKNGMDAPESGAVRTNGTTLAEQIGAQIFIDAIAMACPDDPELAVSLVRKAASVSHDGIAVEAACHLAALEAMAFTEKDVNVLLDRAGGYVQNQVLKDMIGDVRDICSRESDWRKVRDYLDPKYGYEVFPGCCHMIPNHAMVIAAILLAETISRNPSPSPPRLPGIRTATRAMWARSTESGWGLMESMRERTSGRRWPI